MKRRRITLIPGDSPMGLRLPLNDLPARARKADSVTPNAIPLGPGMSWSSVLTCSLAVAAKPGRRAAGPDDYEAVVRTALCLEVRGGRLHAFIPPLEYLEDYVEAGSGDRGHRGRAEVPLIIEGYEPPRDPRLQKLLVTPDPGVIEVNVHPSTNWEGLVATTTALYEGGQAVAPVHRNSCSMAAALAPAAAITSPWRRDPGGQPAAAPPDLLRSLITFWQHHPSLSYLFSACSSAHQPGPRVDEGRDEMLYELGGGLFPDVRRRGAAALAGGPVAAQPADRCHRQHPSRGILHRQTVLPNSHRSPGHSRIPGL